MTEMQVLVVETTLPGTWTEMEVGSFAAQIVELSLAACVQFHNIRSVYHWQGEILNESEWSLSFKTSVEASSELLTKLEILHPYDVPQILVHQTGSSLEYSNWITTETAPNSADSLID